MHFKLSSWFALVGLLSFFALSAGAQAPTAAGGQVEGTIVAKRVTGEVQYRPLNDPNAPWVALKDDMEIKQKNVVRTGQNSSVVLVFSNGASINLAYDSTLNIEEFTQDPFNAALAVADAESEPSNSRTNLTLTHGELVGKVKKLKDANSQFRVGTPVGAAGIRGTTFRIVYRPTGNGQAFNFIMTTLEGNVEVTVGTGTVTTPPVQVTDNQQVVVADVQLNTTTNQVTFTAPTGQTMVVDAPPVVVQAPTTTVQQVQASAQQIATAVAAVIFNPPPTPNSSPIPTSTSTSTPTQPQEQQNQQQQGQNQQQQQQQNQQGQSGSGTPNTNNQNSNSNQSNLNQNTNRPPTSNQPASPGTSSNNPRITNPGGTP